MTAMPSTPLATRSSRICRCSAELPVGVMRKSTSTSPSSFADSLQPARAKVQKFTAVLLTNASFNFFCGAAPPEFGVDSVAFSFLQPQKTDPRQNANNNEQIFFLVGFD